MMQQSAQVLAVDDDPTMRLALQGMLQARGYRCAVVESGQEALRYLDRHGADVLITDLLMPGMDGVALLTAVRSQGLLTRCIVLTGYATIANLTACLREGAVALVAKPLHDPQPLYAAIDHALAQLAMWRAQMAEILRQRGG
ncbi:MAG: response regulator [Planctomycetota bacterium]|nr:response regulator [Planctomycetota bacterium]MCX8038975.1 response regulator [Planctomycetota bacterium]MDW8372774.1 response regulator [Planctomycetota bacterium]